MGPIAAANSGAPTKGSGAAARNESQAKNIAHFSTVDKSDNELPSCRIIIGVTDLGL
jgi:hypothetical protein